MQTALAKAVTNEKHNHSRARWYGISGDQSGNDWAADTLNPFQAISGNADYGADADDEAKVFGTDDTPLITGQKYFDLHELHIVDVSNDNEFKLRIVYGIGTMAAAIAAGQYSEAMVKFDSASPQISAANPVIIQMPKILIDTKVWIQCKNATDNATIDFYVGAHGYDK